MSLIRADARHIPLVDGCVQCCVTSPPYWGLRDYGAPGQIGLEPTPDAYVQTLVQVFREVWRVLRDDATVWLNLGDSYHGGGYANHQINGPVWLAAHGGDRRRSRQQDRIRDNRGLKPKDLVGIPWRVAFALQADGWYLRSDIIWHKPSPMPESVTDRPTKAHEYLFLLSKSASYYYDAEAIAEVAECFGGKAGYGGYSARAGAMGRQPSGNEKPGVVVFNKETRNKRSVWTVATQPYAEAHFATFPPALIEPCILAGSRLGDLVLDPFCGTGTTLAVAERFGRRAVGTDLSYQELARERTAQRGLRFGAPDDARECDRVDLGATDSQGRRSLYLDLYGEPEDPSELRRAQLPNSERPGAASD